MRKTVVLFCLLGLLALAYAPPTIEGPDFDTLSPGSGDPTTTGSGTPSATPSSGGPVLNQGSGNPFSGLGGNTTPSPLTGCETIMGCLGGIDKLFIDQVFF